MICPYCNNDETKVIDSRDSKDGNSIKRRRECLSCEKRFSTVEKLLKLDLEVQKSNGKTEVFSLGKLKNSLLKACEKRNITLEQIDNILELILQDLKQHSNTIIATKVVGRSVLKNLKELDEIAFLRFAIVHNNYLNIKELESEISSLKNFNKDNV